MKRLTDLMGLHGRVAFVTGAAGYIGRAICETLMELGADVVVSDRVPQQCNDRCAELNTLGFQGQAISMPADLSKEQEIRDAIAKTHETLGELDILIHAAAFVGTTQYPGWVVPFPEQTLDAWDACMRVNLSAAFLLSQAAQTYLAQSEHASIIFISSIHGIVGPDMRLYEGTKMGNPAAYGASKAALCQLTRYLATVLAPQIRVNAVVPGGIWRNQPESFHEKYKQRTPLGRMGFEDDLKGVIAYLTSDLSRYVTGTSIVVDGGYTAW